MFSKIGIIIWVALIGKWVESVIVAIYTYNVTFCGFYLLVILQKAKLPAYLYFSRISTNFFPSHRETQLYTFTLKPLTQSLKLINHWSVFLPLSNYFFKMLLKEIYLLLILKFVQIASWVIAHFLCQKENRLLVRCCIKGKIKTANKLSSKKGVPALKILCLSQIFLTLEIK